MTAFSYTTGNPNNLLAGSSASMADIQGPLVDIRTKLNDGTLDEMNVPNLAGAFTYWRTIAWGGGAANASVVTSTATFILYGPYWSNANANPQAIGGASAPMAFRLDPADWTANARTTKLRIRWQAIAGSTAPAATITTGLYPVTAFTGASPLISTLGAVITGSTGVFTTPAANSNTAILSSEFNAPAAGDYVFAFSSSAAFAAGAWLFLLPQLQMRQV